VHSLPLDHSSGSFGELYRKKKGRKTQFTQIIHSFVATFARTWDNFVATFARTWDAVEGYRHALANVATILGACVSEATALPNAAQKTLDRYA
jgi:hypothetical protein